MIAERVTDARSLDYAMLSGGDVLMPCRFMLITLSPICCQRRL